MQGGRDVKPPDLIEVARELASSNRGKPKQAFLHRACSATYYAMFHALAGCCADTLIGGKNSDRSKPAWRQVYRSLEHGLAKSQCENQRKLQQFPKEIQDFANLFVTMQTKRHRADYDPFAKATKSAVALDIEQVQVTLQGFSTARMSDRRAFAAFVLLRTRNEG